jgi:hypothetical protein
MKCYYHLDYIWEELALIDANNVKLAIKVANLFESLGTQGLHGLPIGQGFSKNDAKMGGKTLPRCFLTCHEWQSSLRSSECRR